MTKKPLTLEDLARAAVEKDPGLPDRLMDALFPVRSVDADNWDKIFVTKDEKAKQIVNEWIKGQRTIVCDPAFRTDSSMFVETKIVDGKILQRVVPEEEWRK